jgi:hypothetical protein
MTWGDLSMMAGAIVGYQTHRALVGWRLQRHLREEVPAPAKASLEYVRGACNAAFAAMGKDDRS